MHQPSPRPAGHLGPAFQLIRNLLADRPRTFQQLLQDGVAHTSTSRAGPSTPNPEPSPTPIKKPKAKAPRKGLQAATVNSVPEGHPFISANFLKTRILPVLSSQDLIVKSSKPTIATPSGTFAWSLASPEAPTDDSPRWDTEAHWKRLLSYKESPSKVAQAYAQYRAELKEHKKLTALADPVNRAARRTEREVWEWEGRKEGVTTTLEREHLNVRRARGRPEKERARLGIVKTERLMEVR